MLSKEEHESLSRFTIPELLEFMDRAIEQTEATVRTIKEEIELRMMEEAE